MLDYQNMSGEHVLLRGGSGKTTLFNIMTGLLHPSQGRVTYDDVDLYQMSEARRDRFRAHNIGYIFQNHFLLNTMTAIENVEMPLAFGRTVPRSQWRQRSRTLLEQLDLTDRANYYPAQLSTGQRMRVAIARALISTPGVVFADEPTASLDADAANQAMDLVAARCRDNNAMLIVASHDPALTPRFRRFADLDAGRLRLTSEGVTGEEHPV